MELIIVLNPHGSDETTCPSNFKIAVTPVLNPHGSDETRNHYS